MDLAFVTASCGGRARGRPAPWLARKTASPRSARTRKSVSSSIRTRAIDARSGTIMPAFNDAHQPCSAGWDRPDKGRGDRCRRSPRVRSL